MKKLSEKLDAEARDIEENPYGAHTTECAQWADEARELEAALESLRERLQEALRENAALEAVLEGEGL